MITWLLLLTAIPSVQPLVYLTPSSTTYWRLAPTTSQYVERNKTGFTSGQPTIEWIVDIRTGHFDACVTISHPPTSVLTCNNITGTPAGWTFPTPIHNLHCVIDTGQQPFWCGIPMIKPCQRLQLRPQIIVATQIEALAGGLIALYVVVVTTSVAISLYKSDA